MRMCFTAQLTVQCSAAAAAAHSFKGGIARLIKRSSDASNGGLGRWRSVTVTNSFVGRFGMNSKGDASF